MEYWIVVDGQSTGPYELDFLLTNNKLQPDTLVWREGMQEWLPASQVEELKSIFAKAQAPSVPPKVGVVDDGATTRGIYAPAAAVEESNDEYVEPNYGFAGLGLSITLCAVSFAVWLTALVVGFCSISHSYSYYDDYYYDTATDAGLVYLLCYIWPFLFGGAAIIMSVFARKFDKKANYERANVFARKARLFNILNLVTIGVIVTMLFMF